MSLVQVAVVVLRDGRQIATPANLAPHVVFATKLHKHFVDSSDESFESVVAVLCFSGTFVPEVVAGMFGIVAGLEWELCGDLMHLTLTKEESEKTPFEVAPMLSRLAVPLLCLAQN